MQESLNYTIVRTLMYSILWHKFMLVTQITLSSFPLDFYVYIYKSHIKNRMWMWMGLMLRATEVFLINLTDGLLFPFAERIINNIFHCALCWFILHFTQEILAPTIFHWWLQQIYNQQVLWCSKWHTTQYCCSQMQFLFWAQHLPKNVTDLNWFGPAVWLAPLLVRYHWWPLITVSK